MNLLLLEGKQYPLTIFDTCGTICQYITYGGLTLGVAYVGVLLFMIWKAKREKKNES